MQSVGTYKLFAGSCNRLANGLQKASLSEAYKQGHKLKHKPYVKKVNFKKGVLAALRKIEALVCNGLQMICNRATNGWRTNGLQKKSLCAMALTQTVKKC